MLPRVLAALLGLFVSLAVVPSADAATPRAHLSRWSYDSQFNGITYVIRP